MAVTRDEIADYLAEIPSLFPATREDILIAAGASCARPPVIAALQELPDRNYGHLRDLWPHLPNVPVA